MKSYACYPKTQSGYCAPGVRFFNPQFTPSTVDNGKNTMAPSRPGANILRTEGAYVIQLAIPGLSKDQVKIELHEDKLIITGPEALTTSEVKFTRREFDYAGFKRVFRLHKNANTTAISASFENGILTITVPDAQPENIKINIQ